MGHRAVRRARATGRVSYPQANEGKGAARPLFRALHKGGAFCPDTIERGCILTQKGVHFTPPYLLFIYTLAARCALEMKGAP